MKVKIAFVKILGAQISRNDLIRSNRDPCLLLLLQDQTSRSLDLLSCVTRSNRLMQAIGNNVGRIGDTNQNHVEEVMEAHSQCQFVKPVAILLSTLRMFVASIADPNKKHVERQKDG